MRAVIQRVTSGAVHVAGEPVAQIGHGLVILLGIGQGDTEADAAWLAKKIAHLRIFENALGRFDRSLIEVGGEALVVSQFTLYGDARRGRRPSFSTAARPEQAEPLVQRFAELLAEEGVRVSQGRFGAHMLVHIENDGPVTLILDTEILAGRSPSAAQGAVASPRK